MSEQLEAIRARLAAATPGPWFLDASGDSGVYTEARVSDTSSDVASAFRREDEEFIANAPTDMARLLAALNMVEVVAQRLELMGKPHFDYWARQIRGAVNEGLQEDG